MPFLNAFRSGSSKSKNDSLDKAPDKKADLRGQSFEEQSQALSPQAQDQKLKPGPEVDPQRAQNMTQAIDKSAAVFEAERKASDPYGESYLDKHYRHHRNKDKKAEIEAKHQPQEKAKGFLARRREKAEIRKKVEAEYERTREVSPDRARRMRNAEVKVAIQDEARAEAESLHPDDKKAQEAAYEKIWLRNYKLVREYAGGSSEKEKMAVEVSDELIKEQNKDLHKQLVAQAGKDPLALAQADKIFEHARTRTSKEEKEEAKEKEKSAKEEAEKKRKEENAALKGQILDKHKGEGRAGKKTAMKEYLEQKKLTAKDQAKKATAERKAEVKANNAVVKQSLKDGVIDKKQAAIAMDYHGEKQRKEKNAAMKSEMTREEYRENKVHRGDGEKFKANKDIGTAIKAVGTIEKVAGKGNKVVGKGAKLFGDEQAQSTMLGTKLATESGHKVKLGGTVNEAAGIIRGAEGITSVAGGANNLINAIGLREDADPSNRERAKGEIVDGVIQIGQGTVSSATGILQSIQAFSNNPAMATAMQLEGIPIVGIVGSTIKLIESAVKLAQAAHRAHKIVGMREDAKANKDDAMAAALKGLRNADLQLVASSTVDVLAASASIAGHAMTLGGITAPAGIALKGLATGMSAVKSVGMKVYNSVQASKAKKAEIRFDQAKKNGAGSEELMKSGKSLITTNVKYSLQIVINAARDGDPVALDYMRLFKLDTKNFEQMSNENIRKFILGSIEKDEEPKTLLDELKEIPSKVRDTKRTLRKKIGAGY